MPLNNLHTSDPAQTYQGPAFTQPQVDPHDPSQAIQNLQNMAQGLADRYGPMFKKYIDKAVDTMKGGAQPKADLAPVPAGNQKFDATKVMVYNSMIKAILPSIEMVGVSGKLLEKSVQVQKALNQELKVFIELNNSAKKYFNPQGQFLANEDSNQLFENLQESFQKIEGYISSLQQSYEQGFDKLGKFQPMQNNSPHQTIKPV